MVGHRILVVAACVLLCGKVRAEEPGAGTLVVRGAGAYTAGGLVGGASTFGALLLALQLRDPSGGFNVPTLAAVVLGPPLLTTLATSLVWTAGRRWLDPNAVLLTLGVYTLGAALALRYLLTDPGSVITAL